MWSYSLIPALRLYKWCHSVWFNWVKPVPFLSDQDIMMLSMKTWGLPAKFPLRADAESLDWWKAKATANSQNWIQKHVAFDGLRICHRSQWSHPVVKICGILVPESWYGIIDAQPRGLFTLGHLGQRLNSRKWSSPCDSYMVTLLDSFSW